LNEQSATPESHTAQSEPAEARPTAAVSRVDTGSIADGCFRQLDPRSIQAARISGAISSAILAVVALIGVLTLLLTARPGLLGALMFAGGWLVLCALLATVSIFWPGVRHRYISYRLDPLGLRIRRGVVWRSETSVPKSRIQHTDVSQGPIERGFGIATLIVHTAGTENASVSLGGLSHDVALRIRDFLLEVGDDDAV
jgi:membrane protein YdbS with pleckstrin-like domain